MNEISEFWEWVRSRHGLSSNDCEEAKFTAPTFTPPTTDPIPLPNDFPSDHPSYQEAHDLFMTLSVTSDEDYLALSLRERYLFNIIGFDTYLMSSGIQGYLHSGEGNRYKDCLAALMDIGANDSYRLLKWVCGLFPDAEPSEDLDQRRLQMESFDLDVGELEAHAPCMPEYELFKFMIEYWHKKPPAEQAAPSNH